MIKIEAIEITQPIGKFYIGKVMSTDLWNMSTVDIMRISSDNDNIYKGIQRKLIPSKIKKITAYLESSDSTFPNTIIVNVKKSDFVNYENGFLCLKDNSETFTIIDGQHRLQGLKEQGTKNFEVAVSIFVGLDTEDQSRIFVTINTEQTKVDPSVGLYNELNSSVYTPRKMVVKIAELFNVDRFSPWHKMIKLIGRKDEVSEDGLISLNAFAYPIIERIYDDEEQYHILRNCLVNNSADFTGIKTNYLWTFYQSRNEQAVYKILFNYFSAVKKVFKNDWKNSKSILNKTTGYNALMLLFDDLYNKGVKIDDLSEDFFFNTLKTLKSLDGSINSSNYSTSGEKAANDLYQVFTTYLKIY